MDLQLTEDRARSYTFSPQASDERIISIFGDDGGTAGVTVTESAVMGVAAIWRALDLVSSTVGRLPLLLYQRQPRDDGLPARSLITETPLADLLRYRPNPETTAITFWSTFTLHALQWGNGYAEIQRDPAGNAIAFWPIHSTRCAPVRLRDDENRLVLRYRVDFDTPNDDGLSTIYLHPDDVLHLPGMSFNGLTGLSVIQHARASMGLTIAAERYGASFFANSGRPSGILRYPGKLGPEAAENLRNSWRTVYGGANSQGTPVLEQGVEYQSHSLPPDDAQFIATRQTQVLEVARWFGVPPHKLMSMENATFSNIEHQGAEFREDTITKWAAKIEQELAYKVLRTMPGPRMFVRLDMDDLVQPSLSERADAYMKLRQAGILNTDEIRAREGLAPLPGSAGQTYLHPVNMAILQADGTALLPFSPGENSENNLPPTEPSDEGDENRQVGLGHMVPIFADVFERMVKREERAKEASKAEDRAAWLAEWAVRHRAWVADQLLAPMRAALVAQSAPTDTAADLAGEVAKRWCEGITVETRSVAEPEMAVAAAIDAARWTR